MLLHRLPGQFPGLLGADGRGNLHQAGKGRMPAEPGADFGGVPVAAIVETAVLVAAGRRVGLGFGMTQQHQTAHGQQSRFVLSFNLQAQP